VKAGWDKAELRDFRLNIDEIFKDLDDDGNGTVGAHCMTACAHNLDEKYSCSAKSG
jgi:hypothetical protein